MKNVLVHYDSSHVLENIVDAALLYKTVFENPMITFAYIKEKNTEEKETREKLTKILNSKNLISNVKFVSKEGKPFVEIVNIAKDINADVVIIKTEEKKGFSFFNDNTPFYTATNSPCPVFTIQDEFEFKGVRSLVLPIGSSPETRQKIPFAINIAKHFKAEIHLLAFGTDANNKEERMKLEGYGDQSRTFIENKGVRASLVIEYGKDPVNMIQQFAKRKQGDLIIITAEDDSGLFSNSYTEKIITSSATPILSIQPKDLKVSWAGL